MKLKLFFFFIICTLCYVIANGQDFPFKNEVKKSIDAADEEYLKNLVAEYFKPEANFSYQFTTADIVPDKPETEASVPSSFKIATALQKQILATKESVKKASLYLELGKLYNRLNRRQLAAENFEMAFNSLSHLLEDNSPDSFLLVSAAFIRIEQGLHDDALAYLYRLKEINEECNIMASSMIPLVYLNAHKVHEARLFVDSCLNKWPEGEIGLINNFYVQLAEFMSSALQSIDFILSPQYKALPADSLFDLKRFYNLYTKYPGEVKWEQFYKSAQVMVFYMKNAVIFKLSNTTDIKNLFNFTEDEKKLLQNIRTDFERLAADSTNKNKYFAYKTIGFIEVLLQNFDTGLFWLGKAAKEKRKLTFNNNNNDIYNNLIAAYLMKGDTAAGKKALLKKINDKPAIDPLSADYSELASYFWWEKKYDDALVQFNKAVEYDSTNEKALAGVAAYELLKGNAENANSMLYAGLTKNRNHIEICLLYGITCLMQKKTSQGYLLLKTALRSGASEKYVFEIMDRFFEREVN